MLWIYCSFFFFFFSLVFPQLLNQFENTGPPPADREKIKNLPTVQITEEHVGESLPAECVYYWCIVGGYGETSDLFAAHLAAVHDSDCVI